MITTGLALAIVTGAGFYWIYLKLPEVVRRFMLRHALLTDAAVCILTYCLFGGTLIALFAAAWLGLIVSIMLAIINNPQGALLLKKIAEKIAILKAKISEILTQHCLPQIEEEQKQ
jgi:hypothetical protein